MKRFLIPAVSALLVGALATTAQCASGSGHSYVRASLGYNVLDDLDFTVSSYDVHLLDAYAGFDDGVYTSAAVGYEHGSYRFDVELGYGENTFNTVTWVSGPYKLVEDFDGNINSMSIMANAYLNGPEEWPVSPYVGLGAGWTNVEVEGTNIYGYGLNDNTAVFAYQATVGILFKINSTLSIDAGYRYFKTNDFSLQTIVDETKFRYEGNYLADIYMVGLKYNF